MLLTSNEHNTPGSFKPCCLLVFCRKDLCEARVNLEVCLYLADKPTLADGPPGQSSMDLWKTITLNNFHDRLSLAPLLQSTIDPWKTITPNNFHDRLTLPPPPIDHRSLEDHYTT